MHNGLQIEVSEENQPVMVEFLEEFERNLRAGCETEEDLRVKLQEYLNKPEEVRDREAQASLQRIARLARRTM